jgi:hypothetical protein
MNIIALLERTLGVSPQDYPNLRTFLIEATYASRRLPDDDFDKLPVEVYHVLGEFSRWLQAIPLTRDLVDQYNTYKKMTPVNYEAPIGA